MIPPDDYSPIYVGDTAARFVPRFRHKDGTVYDLRGATLSLKMVNTDDKSPKDGAGAWTLDDAEHGLTHYDYGAADVNEVGLWEVWAIANFGGRIVHADPKILEIKYAP